jgi:hypothetical protein
MFTLEKKNLEQRLDECAERAQVAREAGKQFFQIYFPDGDDDGAEFDTSHVIETLESLGWTLENIGQAGEPADAAYARIESTATTKVVGTIYTFRAGPAPPARL